MQKYFMGYVKLKKMYILFCDKHRIIRARFRVNHRITTPRTLGIRSSREIIPEACELAALDSNVHSFRNLKPNIRERKFDKDKKLLDIFWAFIYLWLI
jgi:hypothetical protein